MKNSTRILFTIVILIQSVWGAVDIGLDRNLEAIARLAFAVLFAVLWIIMVIDNEEVKP